MRDHRPFSFHGDFNWIRLPMEHRGAALPLAVLGDAGNAVQGVPRSQVTQALHFLEDRDSPAVGMCVDGSDFRSGITTTKWSANAVRTTDEVTKLALPNRHAQRRRAQSQAARYPPVLPRHLVKYLGIILMGHPPPPRSLEWCRLRYRATTP